MFCSKCGGNLAEGTVFCPTCGAKLGSGIQPVTGSQKTMVIKVSRILAIIGLVLFPFCLFSYFGEISTDDEVAGVTFVAFGYALAQAIVALVQGGKHKIMVMSIMGILGIVWYVFSSICILAFMYEDWEISQGWAILGLGYALAFSIVTFVKSKLR
jgi:hypothetical protein